MANRQQKMWRNESGLMMIIHLLLSAQVLCRRRTHEPAHTHKHTDSHVCTELNQTCARSIHGGKPNKRSDEVDKNDGLKLTDEVNGLSEPCGDVCAFVVLHGDDLVPEVVREVVSARGRHVENSRDAQLLQQLLHARVTGVANVQVWQQLHRRHLQHRQATHSSKSFTRHVYSSTDMSTLISKIVTGMSVLRRV